MTNTKLEVKSNTGIHSYLNHVIIYLKMDELSKVEIVKRDRKKIIICPHHTVMGWDALDISNFLRYSELFV